jgi:hypothetical protein
MQRIRTARIGQCSANIQPRATIAQRDKLVRTHLRPRKRPPHCPLFYVSCTRTHPCARKKKKQIKLSGESSGARNHKQYCKTTMLKICYSASHGVALENFVELADQSLYLIGFKSTARRLSEEGSTVGAARHGTLRPCIRGRGLFLTPGCEGTQCSSAHIAEQGEPKAEFIAHFEDSSGLPANRIFKCRFEKQKG